MQEYDEDFEKREKRYKECFESMRKVKLHFIFYRAFNVFFNAVLFLVSFLITNSWMYDAGRDIQLKRITDESTVISVSDYIFPASAVTLFFIPGIIAMSILADNYLRRNSAKIALWIYMIIVLFSFTNLIFGYEPMYIHELFLLLAYSSAGAVSQYIILKNFDILDHLSHLEGYPDFNYLIDAGNHSKYVRYRERWLDKNKKQDYFTPNERPKTEFEVSEPAQENGMDGISVDTAAVSGWFEDMSGREPPKPKNEPEDMGNLSADLPDDDYYEDEDIRHKPL